MSHMGSCTGWHSCNNRHCLGTHGTRIPCWKKAKEEMIHWEILGPPIHVVSTLADTIYLSVVADHVHPVIEVMIPGGFGLFQQPTSEPTYSRNGGVDLTSNFPRAHCSSLFECPGPKGSSPHLTT
ncbi:hypothetical protein XENORESO_012236 [Xenotaenia resolanae]|uniref:Uncharacterized protein n=1 Tax=Xenotaenia resolanae TaxID=208358 RepID=A0ABV0WN98_9TELE